MTLKTLGKLTLALALVLAACGDDDGGTVREIGGTGTGTGTGSGSASGTGSGSASASGTGSGSPTAAGECVTEGTTEDSAEVEVAVGLDEFTVEPDPADADAGAVAFVAQNDGHEPHELVIVQAESADDLPTDDDGAMAEDELDEGDLVGEIEEFAPGQTCEATFELDAGSYVLLCNIVEEHEGELEAHFAEGMHTGFTVR